MPVSDARGGPLRVDVAPPVLRWALERARRTPEDLARSIPKLPEWLSGERRPTLKQLQAFARITHTPFGYLVLDEAPDESIPIPDFRTLRDEELEGPSADLLETIYGCERRQAWFRDYVRHVRPPGELKWVGSASAADPSEEVGRRIATALGFSMRERAVHRTWEDALRGLIAGAEGRGVLVMVNGVVGNNTSRVLDPEEFRGFALADPEAPLVFVNGADTKSAQMFTLAHELAHLWLGVSGVSDVPVRSPSQATERWCNQVAAALLMPADDARTAFDAKAALEFEVRRLAKVFKVRSSFSDGSAIWTSSRSVATGAPTVGRRGASGSLPSGRGREAGTSTTRFPIASAPRSRAPCWRTRSRGTRSTVTRCSSSASQR